MGHPVLKRRAEEVANPTASEVQKLISDMRETMADAGGVGLAAPQVHVPLRLVIFEVTATRRGEDQKEREVLVEQVLINPVIQPRSEELEVGWEGCLSVPELRGAVPRHTRIHYQGSDDKGALIDREVYGFHARVVQHECDHLEGILYPMRMTDLTSLHYTSEMRFNAETFSASADS